MCAASNTECKPILVIEDEQLIRETLQLALEMDGYSVFTAANGKEGVELLNGMPEPCVILLDLMMPVMNGWQFVDEISKTGAFAKIPIVVVTAYGDQAKTLNVKEVLNKPVSLDDLLKTIEKWCGEPPAPKQ